jgi:feruloyl esterase
MSPLARNRLALLIAAVCMAGVALAQQPCGDLKNLTLADVTISLAAPVPAGSFTVPGTQSRTVQMPAFCRVVGVIWPEVDFELWMPAQWNRKFLGVGNGGFAGTISYSAMISPLQAGYATGSTDTGHKASDTTWAVGHFERVVDFGHRAIHAMTQTDKAILRAFYGAAPAHSYFEGCSNGGRQALMEAQRYPADYDGIIAGDPGAYWTHLYTGGHLWVVRALDGDGYIPTSKVPVIANAVNKACDAMDGIEDGILNDPRRCHFDPSVLLCKGADGSACLTTAQLDAVRKLWDGARTADGDQIQPGLLPGGEDGPGGWAQWITGTGPATGGHAGLGLPAFKYIIFENPNWDYRSFKYDAPQGFDNDVDFTDQKASALLNATDPDLRPFQALGGKLIQYHGLSDPDITPLNSIHYYEQVAQVVGHGSNHGIRDTSQFYRLFLVPGMQHCGGGPGPNTFSMLGALDQWVERGVAPEKIVASHLTSGKVDRTRPLCPYPQEAQWKGSGSTDQAENFACVLPSRP